MNLVLGLKPGSTSPFSSFSTHALRLSLLLVSYSSSFYIEQKCLEKDGNLASASSPEPPVVKDRSTHQALTLPTWQSLLVLLHYLA